MEYDSVRRLAMVFHYMSMITFADGRNHSGEANSTVILYYEKSSEH